MRRFTWNPFAVACGVSFALAFLLAFPSAALAQQNWKATVGAQSEDMGRQAEAFLPNEFWIHAGDTITWTFASGDTHTVTFLLVGQPFPLSFTGVCPSGAVFDGITTCVSSMPSVTGQKFAATFTTTGNFELVCLVHPQMFGTIHVLANSQILPHDQAFYDEQAKDERSALLDDLDPPTSKSHHSMTGMLSASVIAHTKGVIAGFGEIAATAGGQESLSVVRFIDGTVEIHAGDTVEWSNLEPDNRTYHHLWNGTGGSVRPVVRSKPWVCGSDRSGRRTPRHHHGTGAKRALGIYLCSPRRLYRWFACTATSPVPSGALPRHLHAGWNLQLQMLPAR